MDKPVIADKKPAGVNLNPGTYYWCSCGKSGNQPFCNGAHQGTSFTPLEFQVTEKKRILLCNCKSTSNPPYCDGSHRNLV